MHAFLGTPGGVQPLSVDLLPGHHVCLFALPEPDCDKERPGSPYVTFVSAIRIVMHLQQKSILQSRWPNCIGRLVRKSSDLTGGG